MVQYDTGTLSFGAGNRQTRYGRNASNTMDSVQYAVDSLQYDTIHTIYGTDTVDSCSTIIWRVPCACFCFVVRTVCCWFGSVRYRTIQSVYIPLLQTMYYDHSAGALLPFVLCLGGTRIVYGRPGSAGMCGGRTLGGTIARSVAMRSIRWFGASTQRYIFASTVRQTTREEKLFVPLTALAIVRAAGNARGGA
jgi:hypothetical protein